MSKYGHHYSTCDVGDSEGNVFVTGLRDISGSEAQTYLESLKEIFSDISACADVEGGCTLGLECVMELARKSKEEQRKQYKKRRMKIRRIQEQKMADSLEQKQIKEHLVEKIEEYGNCGKPLRK